MRLTVSTTPRSVGSSGRAIEGFGKVDFADHDIVFSSARSDAVRLTETGRCACVLLLCCCCGKGISIDSIQRRSRGGVGTKPRYAPYTVEPPPDLNRIEP